MTAARPEIPTSTRIRSEIDDVLDALPPIPYVRRRLGPLPPFAPYVPPLCEQELDGRGSE